MKLFTSVALLWMAAASWMVAADREDSDALPAPAGTPGTPGVDWSPAQKLPPWIQLSGQIRGRLEDPSGTSMLNQTSDAYYASRIRLDLGISPVRWLKFFVQAQDARTADFPVTPAPTTVYNPFDLRQAYVDLSHEGAVNVAIRAGRQQMQFGGERVIGPSDWGMSRTFDAVDLSIEKGKARVDLFAGSVVLIDPTRIDRHKPGEHFYGAYGSRKGLPGGINIEPYIFFKQTLLVKSETGVLGDALVISPGFRVFGKIAGRVDYIAEMLVQGGTYSSDRIRAWGGSWLAGWTIADVRWAPRISAEYTYASGDGTLKDGRRNTFDQFYPSNHTYLGQIDQFGWKNIKYTRAGFDCSLTKKLKLKTDFYNFSLATVQDSLYNSAGTSALLNRKATSGHIGFETNTLAFYQWTKVWRFGVGYGHLFAGDYLKQSKVNFGYSYPFVTFVGSF